MIEKLKVLYTDLKRCKGMRKEYSIKPTIKFEVNDADHFFLIPTIMIMPWIYRFPNSSVVDILWLNCCICIGKWVPKEISENE